MAEPLKVFSPLSLADEEARELAAKQAADAAAAQAAPPAPQVEPDVPVKMLSPAVLSSLHKQVTALLDQIEAALGE